MAEQSAPWTGGTVDDSSWRAFRRATDADGVINDTTATCLRVSATGSSTEVTVSAGEAVIQGAHYILDAPLTLDVAAVGSAPASGQTRIDLVVLRYDATQVTPADRVRMVVIPGTPATSGAVEPTLTRNPTGVWEHPIARITRLGNVAVTTSMITQLRMLSSPTMYVGQTAAFPSDAADGSIAFQADDIRARILTGGSMQWRSIINPPWTSLTMASGYVSAGRTPAYRVLAGHLELRGEVRRSTGAEFPASTWLTIASVPSSLVSGLTASNWPRIPVAMSDFIGAGELRLTNTGLIQLAKSSAATAHDRPQSQAWLDGARFPLA